MDDCFIEMELEIDTKRLLYFSESADGEGVKGASRKSPF